MTSIETKNSETKNSETKNSETKNSETKNSETKNSETKNNETKNSETKNNETKKINVLSSNVFNSTPIDGGINEHWRNLTNEKRTELLNNYFNTEFNNENTDKTIDNNTISMIIGLSDKGKMKLKKEITYDKVNERILQIHALVPESHTDYYVYKPEILVKKEKSKKIAKTVLFRKK
jgi:hypothetical protein